MNIYEEEKSLASLLTQKCVGTLVVPVKVTEDNDEAFLKNIEGIKREGCDPKLQKALASLADGAHPDLMYGSAILVSTVMNKNDDVFLPEETWAARNTPVNTPFNDDHVDTDIIGHIIAARPLDSEGKLIEADVPPQRFDIGVDFVVYKSIFPAIAREIAEKAPLGQKFVSMEARMSGFDYALVDSEGNYKIVARNNDTAFLTKYLRVYGGEGTYQDNKIGRVLRNFRFTGMGSVDIPANPTSEFTSIDKYEVVSHEAFVKKVKRETGPKVVLYITKGNIMTIETLEQAKTLIASLTSDRDEANKKLNEVNATLNTLKEEKTGLAGQLTAEQEKVRLATEQLDQTKTELEGVKAELTTVKADLQTKATELQNIQKTAKAEKRAAELKDLGVTVDDKKKEEIANWSDETFASVLEFTKTVKPSEKKDAAADVAAATTQANQTLEGAKETDADKADVTATAGDDKSKGEEIQAVATKLSEAFFTKRNNRKDRKDNKKE